MKVAKADNEEFDKVYKFINVMDNLLDNRSWYADEDDWKNWDDDDQDKIELLKIEKEVKETDGGIWGDVDNRLVLFEFIKKKWREVNYSGSFQRIVTNAEVLIDNVCDPNLDYLEYKPEIKEAIDKYEQEKSSK